MLDYNHSRSFAELLNDAVDTALTAENASRPRREYLGGSSPAPWSAKVRHAPMK